MTEQRVPSSEFRVTFARLTQPVAVTVLGRVIGWWTPVPAPPVAVPELAAAPERRESNGSEAGTTRAMTQTDRDKVLRRITKGAKV